MGGDVAGWAQGSLCRTLGELVLGWSLFVGGSGGGGGGVFEGGGWEGSVGWGLDGGVFAVAPGWRVRGGGCCI